MTTEDLAYLAGIVDGEGYIGVKKSKAYRCQGRSTPAYHARLQVRMIEEAAIRFLSETLGGWYYPEERQQHPQRRPLFCYQASDKKAEHALRSLLPYLRVKKRQAEKVLELCDLKAQSQKHRTKIVGYRDFPNAQGTIRKVPNKSLSDEFVALCESLYLACKEMNRVGM